MFLTMTQTSGLLFEAARSNFAAASKHEGSGAWPKNGKMHKQKNNICATACRAWARAETFNGLQKVLQILCVPGPTTL